MTRKLIRTQYRPLVLVALLLGLCQAASRKKRSARAPPLLPEARSRYFRTSGFLTEKAALFQGRATFWCAGIKIERISTGPIPTDRSATTMLIDGGGRTLMPGLIDMHWHTMLVRPTIAALLTGDIGYLNLVAGAEATDTLMRGFTTVRDVGGPAFGLKRAIDEGTVVGPRIFPSGAMITITSGHGDFRQPFEVPRTLGAPQSRGEQTRRRHDRRQSG